MIENILLCLAAIIGLAGAIAWCWALYWIFIGGTGFIKWWFRRF